MMLLSTLLRLIRGWLDRAGSTAGAASPAPERPDEDETTRRSIDEVTLEQLGITHWSSHTLL